MATARKTGKEKFVTFVNSRIGKQLSTIGISRGIKTNLRTVQSFCKAVRGTRKVDYTSAGKGRGLIYTFKSPISTTEI